MGFFEGCLEYEEARNKRDVLRYWPWWKVSRETVRIGRQTAGLPLELARKIYFRRWYDSAIAPTLRRSTGALRLAGEFGVYLIFPRRGVLGSHFHMLAEMRAQGIAPVVVSNFPLSEADRARLLPEVARLIERPNIGYDFGGYRDAILDLADHFALVDRLWLLNDSVWLVPQRSSWFEDARVLGTDFVAATSHFAMPRVDPDRFREIIWHYDTSRRDFHYASFALGVGNRALRDPDFLQFWRKLDIRDDKKRTVRRGEIGLTQFLVRRGYSHAATASAKYLDVELKLLDNEMLDVILRELVIFSSNSRLESLRTQLLSKKIESDDDRKERITFILTCVTRQPSAYLLASANVRNGFQFLKKSPLRLSRNGVQEMMAIISRIEGSVGRVIRHEAEDIVKRATLSIASHRAV